MFFSANFRPKNANKIRGTIPHHPLLVSKRHFSPIFTGPKFCAEKVTPGAVPSGISTNGIQFAVGGHRGDILEFHSRWSPRTSILGGPPK